VLEKKMKKVLYITPHLSTGGLPQYLLYKIGKLKESIEAYVIEYEQITGNVFVVQRDKIRDLIGKDALFSLNAEKNEILSILEKVKPDIIHFEEIPETFVSEEILQNIYVTKREQWNIVETTHDSKARPEKKRFLPDMFVMPCEFSKQEIISSTSQSAQQQKNNNYFEKRAAFFTLNINYLWLFHF
jgi:hypothetical protein